MPRKEGQKRKLLVLLQILARETDERHPLSVPQIVEKLKEKGIEAERKSVYDDLNTLNEMPDFPYEIMQKRGRGGGYYMTDAPFELAELKLLVDAVYASKFITARKSKVLIDKLGQFTSCYRQEELNRKVLVSGRLKSTDEKILYTVDALHAAITAVQILRLEPAKKDDPPSRWPAVPHQPLGAGVGECELLPYRLHRGPPEALPCGQDAGCAPAARYHPRRRRRVRQL